jgi:CRP-like cAMP-binding protein
MTTAHLAVRSSAEAAAELVPFFRTLKPDERVRLSRQLRIAKLEPGQQFELTADRPSMIIVVSGDATLTLGQESVELFAGDVIGVAELVDGRGLCGALVASRGATVATLDPAGLDAILSSEPSAALPLLADLSRELRRSTEMVREVCLARAEGLHARDIEVLLGRRARTLHLRGGTVRKTAALLGRTLLVEPARTAPFWAFAGILWALVSARTVVAIILTNGLQKKLFALIAGQTGHPIHVHHFNYGLLVVSLVGLLSMLPGVRTSLRFLSFALGFGMGLIVDEFALFWNLDPNYYQPSSRLAAGLVLFVMVQVVYFRSLYAAALKRIVARVFS